MLFVHRGCACGTMVSGKLREQCRLEKGAWVVTIEKVMMVVAVEVKKKKKKKK